MTHVHTYFNLVVKFNGIVFSDTKIRRTILFLTFAPLKGNS